MTPGMVDTEMGRAAVGHVVSTAVPEWKGGEAVFNATFVSRKPSPDFIYPYWFPSYIYGWEAPESKVAKRHSGDSRAYMFRPEKNQKLNYQLHASVAPEFLQQFLVNLR